MLPPYPRRGVLMDPSIPNGSPLDPNMGAQPMQGALSPSGPPPGALSPAGAPQGTDPTLLAPQALPATVPLSGAPAAPEGTITRKVYKPFSKENRQDALLAIGTGLLSHPESFAAGIGVAGQQLGDLRKRYQAPDQTTMGGPDNAFQITTDPRTGEQTFKPIPQVQQYVKDREAAKHAPSGKDTVAMRASTAQAILNLPPEQQPAAYAALKADGARLGYDLGMPDQFSPHVLTSWRDQGITPTAELAAAGRDNKAAADKVEADRKEAHRKEMERQGAVRLKWGPPPRKPVTNSDLDY